MTNFIYKATNIRIIDGDTIEAVVDLGFRISHKVVFRLDGINAPECDKESKKFISDFVEGKEVIIESRKTEKYGRWLATVWIGDLISAINLNQELVAHGLAKPYNGGKR